MINIIIINIQLNDKVGFVFIVLLNDYINTLMITNIIIHQQELVC